MSRTQNELLTLLKVYFSCRGAMIFKSNQSRYGGALCHRPQVKKVGESDIWERSGGDDGYLNSMRSHRDDDEVLEDRLSLGVVSRDLKLHFDADVQSRGDGSRGNEVAAEHASLGRENANSLGRGAIVTNGECHHVEHYEIRQLNTETTDKGFSPPGDMSLKRITGGVTVRGGPSALRTAIRIVTS